MRHCKKYNLTAQIQTMNYNIKLVEHYSRPFWIYIHIMDKPTNKGANSYKLEISKRWNRNWEMKTLSWLCTQCYL